MLHICLQEAQIIVPYTSGTQLRPHSDHTARDERDAERFARRGQGDLTHCAGGGPSPGLIPYSGVVRDRQAMLFPAAGVCGQGESWPTDLESVLGNPSRVRISQPPPPLIRRDTSRPRLPSARV